jgi:hypothetical protein
MNFFEYKNHTIYPTPRLQIATGYWRVQLSIRHRHNIKIFSHENVFATKGEAVFHCITYGKKLIDDGIEF